MEKDEPLVEHWDPHEWLRDEDEAKPTRGADTAKRRRIERVRPALPIVEHWGLDPLFWTHVKLFIGDVLALPPMPGYSEPFNLNGHPVTRVAVMGIIVEALPRPRHLALSVDDGTGRIQCAYYANSVDEGGVPYSDLQVGCLASIQGKLHHFRQQRSIAIYRIGIEEDPNAETQHMLDVVRLGETIYQRPSPVSAFSRSG